MARGRVRSRRGTLLRLDAQQLDLEEQGRPGWDRTVWSPSFTVAQFRGDAQLDLSTFADQLQPFGPAFDDVGERKSGRLTTPIRTIEFSPVVKTSTVIDGYGIPGRGLATVTWADYLIAEPGGSVTVARWVLPRSIDQRLGLLFRFRSPAASEHQADRHGQEQRS